MPAHTVIDADTPLSVQTLRELMREARGGFVPDYVGGLLRNCFPAVIESEADEVATMLHGLLAAARDRLHDAGIELSFDERAKAQKLLKREREYVVNAAALAIHTSGALMLAGMLDEALIMGKEALAWCRTIEDHRQESIAWRVVTMIYSGLQQVDELEPGARRGLAAARLSGSVEEIVASIDFLCSFLVVQYRTEEAEALNEEGLALARESDEAGKFLPALLLDNARIKIHHTSYVDGIRMCREALRLCDDGGSSYDRATILSFLGTTYLRLGHYGQCIECHHEVIRIAETCGSDIARGWGYFRLAEAHFLLEEMKRAEEMLDRADECASRLVPQLSCAVTVKRTQIYAATDRLDAAADLCYRILANNEADWLTWQVATLRTLAGIEERRERYEQAEKHHRRAIEISSMQTSLMTPAFELSLAELLHKMGREEEVEELLDGIEAPGRMAPAEQVRMLHLRAAIAEKNDDLGKALDYEREAFAIEREMLERRAEESLRNARIVADTDLLEREAELERERRRRLEHELADAAVEISDRRRLAESVEQRLRTALKEAGSDPAVTTTTVLRETLSDLRSQAKPQESPLRYLGGVDEDFYRRLRQRCPDLTSKQERLCALLRAGLGSREISTLLQLGPEGLKAQRKRLRKRLGLSEEERLETVLAEI